MNKDELFVLAKQELIETPLVVTDGGVLQLRKHTWNLLLFVAREEFKGRKGLYSRKSRVRKKLVKAAASLLINRGWEALKADGVVK